MEYRNYIEDCSEYGGNPLSEEEFYNQVMEEKEVL